MMESPIKAEGEQLPDWVLPIRRFVCERTYVRLSDLVATDLPWEPSSIYKAIAQAYVYVDLEHCDLSTPSNCFVYPDKLTQELVSLTHVEQSHVRSRTINELCPGDMLTWNTAIYVLDAIEESEIVLHAESGKILRIPKDRFHEILESEVTVVHHRHDEEVDKDVVLPPMDTAQKKRLLTDVTYLRHALECNTPPPREESRLRTLYFYAKKRGGINCNLAVVAAPKDYLKGNTEDKAPDGAMERAIKTLRTYRVADPPEDVSDCWNRYYTEGEKQYLPTISRTTFFELDAQITPMDKVGAYRGDKGAYQVKPRTGARHKNAVLESKAAWHMASMDSSPVDIFIFDEMHGFIYRSGPMVRLTDLYSRVPLAITLSLLSPSSLTSLALIQACLFRHKNLPLIIIVDQGSEFDNIDFEMALAAYGVTLVRRRGSAGRDGGEHERQNKDFDDRFLDSMSGNTRQLKNPRGLDPAKNPENLAVWTPKAFAEEAQHYCFETYPNLNNEGLGATPLEKYNFSLDTIGLPKQRVIMLDEQTQAGLLPSTKPRQLTANPRTGCRYKRITYWHPCYREPNIAMQKFDTHRAPFDISYLWMFINKQWVKIISDRHAELQGMTEVEAHLISQMHYTDGYRTSSRRNCNSLILAANRQRVREREDALKEIRAAEISQSLMFGTFANVSNTSADSSTGTYTNELLLRARSKRRTLSDVDV